MSRLALGELEPLARARLTVLLALLGARVTRDESGFLERRAELAVDFAERAGDAVLDGIGLAGEAAATDVDVHVVTAAGLGQLERLHDDHAGGRAAEVIVHRTIVDRDLARPLGHPHARDGVLAPPRRVK